MAHLETSTAFVAPAFPAMGRTSEAGRLWGEKAFQEVSAQERQIIVCDGSVQEDLSLVALAAASIEPRSLVVGSAGLATEVVNVRAKGRSGENPAEYKTSKPLSAAGPAVLFIGSDNPVTVAQVDYLLSNRPSTRLLLGDCPDATWETCYRESATPSSKYRRHYRCTARRGIYISHRRASLCRLRRFGRRHSAPDL
jgi:uncharacterized protein YgbK (DUF1537 family)